MSIVEMPRTEPAPRLRDDEPLFEVINGRVVELPPTSFHANKIASRLVRKVGGFADAHRLGEVVAETLFRLPLQEDAHRNRRPDVAFVSYQRWPREKAESIRDNAWDVVPELVVEVVSPSDVAEALMDKLDEYFSAGVRQVWVVYPRQKLIHIYSAIKSVRAIGESDTLAPDEILPGFELALRDLFVFPIVDDSDNEHDDA